jgi:hypothetical protein
MNPPTYWSLGQKVLCINDTFPPAVLDWCDCLPRAGGVYTIRAMRIGRDRISGQANLGFLLSEIVNPLSSLGKEAGFLAERFTPWLEKCTESRRQPEVEILHYENTGV